MPGQVDPPAANQKRLPHRRCCSRFKPGGELPDPLPAGAHRVHLHADRGPDAQDDGRRGALRHRQAGAAQRLLLGRQNRHRAKDRSGHAHLLEDHAHRLVCRHRAGQQSGDRRGRGHRQSPRARTTAPTSPRRSLPRWRSRCSSISACRTTSMLRPPSAPPKADTPVTEDDAGAGRRRHQSSLRCCQRSAQRRSAARRGQTAPRQAPRRSTQASANASPAAPALPPSRSDSPATMQPRSCAQPATTAVTVTDDKTSARSFAHRLAHPQGHRTGRRRRT